MKVNTMADAFEIAYDKIGEYEYDKQRSLNAGYPIYRSVTDMREYICELGDRIEINLANGKSVNVWIEPVEQNALKIADLELEIIKLKAKLYDMICEKENR